MATRPWSGLAGSPISFSSTTGRSRDPSTTRSCVSSRTARSCFAARVASRPFPSRCGSRSVRPSRWARSSRARWRSPSDRTPSSASIWAIWDRRRRSRTSRRAIDDLSALYAHRPDAVACDLHPDYRSTRSAAALGLPVVGVQHHYAHILSCMTENEIDPPVLGVAWDGTGWGVDGTVWGGEFLRVPARGFERVGHLRTFGLPGSEKAVVEPRRAALGVLFEIYGADLPGDLAPVRAWSPRERATLIAMLEKRPPHAAHVERRAPVRCRGGARRDSPDVHVRGTGRDGARVVARRIRDRGSL